MERNVLDRLYERAAMRAFRSHMCLLLVGIASSCATFGVSAAVASADATSDYNTGLTLGTEAYQYGVPLLDENRVYTTSTSEAKCTAPSPTVPGGGPANEFCSLRTLATASEYTVPAPNNDTLYTTAWLVNLSKQPQVLHAPAIKNRFWEFELLDPWTVNFYNIASISTPLGRGDFGVTGGGNWAVAGPHFNGKVPSGVTLVRSPYDRVWVIGRTFVRGPSDLRNVHRIQDQYSITPLSKFGTAYKFKPPKHHGKPFKATIPGTQPGENPLQFYAALGQQMLKFPPPGADKPLLTQLKAVGIGQGLNPAHAHLSAATLQGLRDAVTQGHTKVLLAFQALYLKYFSKFDGYLISDDGYWGINYLYRAIDDALGIGGQRANIALYPVALYDDAKALLTGSKRCVLHIPKSRLPIPVSAFWSLTLYDTSSFFVPNPLNRYLVNTFSHLRKNPDGSIDIYIQSNEPSNPAQVNNWLPSTAPGEGFRLIWRLYGLGKHLHTVLNGTGWEPPAIQPCDAAGYGIDGTACAS